jgi:hypothetical protein
MGWISKVADVLSAGAPYVFVIAVMTGALLLLPSSLPGFEGLDDWRALARPWIGAAAFIASLYFLAALLFNALEWALPRLKNRPRWRQERRQRHELLHHLTPEECRYLLQDYISRWSQTAYFDIQDGVVAGLVAKEILYPVPATKREPNQCTFRIQPWAYIYLSERPNVLKACSGR